MEAKEGVQIQSENQTLASITFQNYFRMYGKLAGMTGTADTEAYEFQEIYGLETVVIPPNKPTIRKDELDLVYKTAKEKYDAVIEDIRDCHERGQPVLVGTTSIENSELLSGLLEKAKLPHQVLNAKQHAKEAEIVAQAGRPGVITIATNMAGRGTDIVLGGNVEKQVQFIEADEAIPDDEKAAPHPAAARRMAGPARQGQGRRAACASSPPSATRARRIDNQLRGRSGRQGDPGAVALLPVAGRPADAHLRRRPRARDHGPPEDARGRGDRGRHRHAQHRGRAAQGRGAQLRHAQAAARVRRRQQRPAQGHLPAAQRDPRGGDRSTRRSPTCAGAR